MKHRYLVQPYQVGSKTGKSIAFVIPHQIVRFYGIGPSTVIVLKTDNARKRMILEAIQDTDTNEKLDTCNAEVCSLNNEEQQG